MNHKFLPAASDATKCGMINVGRLCLHPEVAHGDKADCDFCDYVGVVDADKKNNLCCPTCMSKNNIGDVIAPIGLNEVLAKSREIDNRITVRTDLFNAETTAIAALKTAIELDDAITNKSFALATEVYNRFQHFKELIFRKNEELIELTTRQRAHQTYLNVMANSLRQEERDKLKLQDINYQPGAVKTPKPIKAVKAPKAAKKKIDKVALANLSKEIGIPEFTIQMICVQKNLSVDEAGVMFRKSIAEAKAQSANTGA